MTRLLRIDTSSRSQGSHSGELADFVEKSWLDHFPRDEILSRDLARDNIPHLSNSTIEAFNTPLAQHTPAIKNASRLSETLIAEFQSADVILLSVPMYNFTIPSVLKAYIDHIVRIGFTFDYHAQKGLYGLLKNKHAIVC
ncbi:MAG: FMN-dependent NADH-azoreductase, partial [Thiohalomonadales bacterium]